MSGDPGRAIWQVCTAWVSNGSIPANSGVNGLKPRLAEGWEPFFVREDREGTTFYLKRLALAAQGGDDAR